MSFDVHRVLLADDDEKTRQILAHYLAKWGFVVSTCRDGNEAAAILEQDTAPALALIDWEMPGLEGVEICRRVRGRAGRHPYTYIILVTGRSDKSEIASGFAAGADDYVTKPFDVDELHARLLVGQRVVSLERRLAEHIARLRDALEQVGQLQDSAPVCICPVCKQTRDSQSRWQPVETYLRENVGTFSIHETCPTCCEKLQSDRSTAGGASPRPATS